MESGTVRRRPATPRPIQAHVAARLGRDRDRVYRALNDDLLYVWQRGYARNRENKYRIDWQTQDMPRVGLGNHEAPLCHWMNFAKYRLGQTLDETLERPLGIRAARLIALWAGHAFRTQEFVVLRNVGLAYAIARSVGGAVDGRTADQDDWRSDAMVALITAVQRFDPARGRRLTTFAYPVILRSLLRTRFVRKRTDALMPCQHDPDLERPPPRRRDPGDPWDLRDVLGNGTLNDREKRVIALRFGLDTQHPETLEGVGRVLSLSKESIRQIERDALRKIRVAFNT